MRWCPLFLLVAAVEASVGVGCDSSVCVDGVCADPDETRTFPGPCASRIDVRLDDHRQNVTDGTFEYDPAGHLTRVVTDFDGWGGTMTNTRIVRSDETRWSYDAAGAVSAIDETTAHWTFEPDRVTHVDPSGTTVYDRASFAFLPRPGREHRMHPVALLGMLSQNTGSGIETYTWTRTGQTLTRTSVYSGDNSMTTLVFQLDDRDRITAWQYTDPDGNKEGGEYVFDGDLLIAEKSSGLEIRYTYDRGGNLIHVDYAHDPSSREVYAYDCWD